MNRPPAYLHSGPCIEALQYPPVSLPLEQQPVIDSIIGPVRVTSRARVFTDVQCHEDRLDQPLRWKKPRRIFVNSMSDLFHEDVPDAFIDRVFAVMALAPQHTFQVLTKRAERMRDYVTSRSTLSIGARHAAYQSAYMVTDDNNAGSRIASLPWPFPNVWLGVSVENQHFADERIPLLLQTPAAIRFISAEPLLGPVDLGLSSATCSCCPRWASRWVTVPRAVRADFPMCLVNANVATNGIHRAESNSHGALAVNGIGLRPHEFEALPALDWVIVGGESGTGARPFDVAWARSIVQQCQAAGVPVFLKQLGASPVIVCPSCNGTGTGKTHKADDFCNQCLGCHRQSVLLRDRKGGDMAEWPEDLRVREFPSTLEARG